MVCKNAVYEKNDIWYIDNNGAINKIGITEHSFFGKIPFETRHPFCAKYKDKIFCMPANGRNIVVYDIKESVYREIAIPLVSENVTLEDFWIEEDSAWLVVKHGKEIINLDLREEEVKEVFRISEQESFAGIFDACMYDNKIYMTSYESSDIYTYDISNNKIETINTCLCDDTFSTIVLVNNRIYLAGEKTCIYSLDVSDHRFLTIDMDKAFFSVLRGGHIFRKSFVFENKIIFIPFTEPEHADSIVILDSLNNSFDYINILKDIFPECNGFGNRYVNILNISESGEMDVYMDNLPIHRYKLDSKKVEIIKTPPVNVSIMKDYYKNPYVLVEAEDCKLSSFIEGLVTFTNS